MHAPSLSRKDLMKRTSSTSLFSSWVGSPNNTSNSTSPTGGPNQISPNMSISPLRDNIIGLVSLGVLPPAALRRLSNSPADPYSAHPHSYTSAYSSSPHQYHNSNRSNLEEDIQYIKSKKKNTSSGGENSKNENNNNSLSYHCYYYYYYYYFGRRENDVEPTWRLKERMKTVGVGLILALNIGTDPQDVVPHKPVPAAVRQCWLDPTSMSRAKAREMIGDRLEHQYAKWQPRAKLDTKRALDPTVEDVRALCYQLRKNSRKERLLLHYNGHGVPKPTSNGEIWVFDKNKTQYIPLSVCDLISWIGKPTLLVLDCSGAGVLLPYLTDNDESNRDGKKSNGLQQQYSNTETSNNNKQTSSNIRDTIVLCPTSENDWLPMHADFPADIFTSCLTTPIPMALQWFLHQNPFMDHNKHVELPGKVNDRKTPLGELNWIFTAITDTIAFNMLPSSLFQRLFRQDLLVASMFRNFLLADRILRNFKCTPVSYPPLPPGICHHSLWQAWDLAIETCYTSLFKQGSLLFMMPPPNDQDEKETDINGGAIPLPEVNNSHLPIHQTNNVNRGNSIIYNSHQLANAQNIQTKQKKISSLTPLQPIQPISPYSLASSSSHHQKKQESQNDKTFQYSSAPFFAEQLTAFEIWLDFAATTRRGGKILPPCVAITHPTVELESPEQLPVVLQVLLSQAHRVRALQLLGRFLDLGPSAVNLALSVGIFPYVLKLLQSPIDEYKHVLVGIWAKILDFDPSCQTDLVKDGALPHFIRHLQWSDPHQRTMAAVILSAICFQYSLGQSECIRKNLHHTISKLLVSSSQTNDSNQNVIVNENAEFRSWLCICLANLVKDNPVARVEVCSKAGIHLRLFERLLGDDSPDVRAGACYALSALLGSTRVQTTSNRSSTQLTELEQSNKPLSNVPGFSPLSTKQNVQNYSHQAPSMPEMSSQPSFAPPGNSTASTVLNPTTVSWQQQRQYTSSSMIHQSPPSAPSKVISQNESTRQNSAAAYRMNMSLFGTDKTPSPPTSTNMRMSSKDNNNDNLYLKQQQQKQDLIESEKKKYLDLDVMILEHLIKACKDMSPMVRYEGMIGLGCCVGKYLSTLVHLVHKQQQQKDQKEKKHNDYICELFEEHGRKEVDILQSVWKQLRSTQHEDPHPAVSGAATSIVQVVNEHVLLFKMDISNQSNVSGGEEKNIVGIDNGRKASSGPTEGEEKLKEQQLFLRATSMLAISSVSDSKNAHHTSVRETSHTEPMVKSGFSDHIANESHQWTPTLSHQNHSEMNDESSFKQGKYLENQYKIEYFLPESEFYAWKKTVFGDKISNSDFNENYCGGENYLDPLSPKGAIQAYRERRNQQGRSREDALQKEYMSLAPRPPILRNGVLDSRDEILDGLNDEGSNDEVEAIENEITSKKQSLLVHQSSMLINHGTRMTSLLQFHSYEPALIACDGTNSISIWNTDSSKKENTFRNGNPINTRVTSLSWINEMSSSLLLTGCDDGSVRIWDGIMEGTGEIVTDCGLSLSSAFFAMPELVANRRGSGLVTEWQQFSGRLIAAGNSKYIRCWDLEAEKCSNVLESNLDECVTTLTTAWDHVTLGDAQESSLTEGYSGIGPDIFVAGFGDGTLKVFDIRSSQRGSVMAMKAEQKVTSTNNNSPQRNTRRTRRNRPMKYSEHTHWIVNTSFSNCGGRYEVSINYIIFV